MSASHLQLMTFGLPWGEDGVLPLTSHQCPTGEPQSHPFKANRTALSRAERAQEASSGGKPWFSLTGMNGSVHSCPYSMGPCSFLD